MNRLDEQYKAMLAEVLYNGTSKDDRTSTGTISKFGMQIKHRMSDGFPVLTTKRLAFKTMVTELKWFLRGDTNIKYLVDNNCNVWNGDAYKNFLKHSVPHDRQETIEEFINKIKTDDEFEDKWGELGPIYGAQWREWDYTDIDQISNLIKGLKEDPNGRRHLVSAWNVSDLKYMVLPPCHYSFQCYVADGKLSLMWNQRSADLFLGVPFNISSYGLLLLLLCEETGYEPGELIGNFGDTHLYSNHVEQAKEQISREPFKLPTIELSNVDILQGEFDYKLKDYIFHPTIKAPLSN